MHNLIASTFFLKGKPCHGLNFCNVGSDILELDGDLILNPLLETFVTRPTVQVSCHSLRPKLAISMNEYMFFHM